MMVHSYKASLLKEEMLALAIAEIHSQDCTVPIRQLAPRIKNRYQEIVCRQEREKSC